jgi:HAMP domain-containing protein
MVLAMANELEAIFASSRYGYRESYYDFCFEYNHSDPALAPTDTAYNSAYDVYLSWSYASYYFRASKYNNFTIRSANLNETIERAANMDYIFQNIHDTAPEFRWLYIAFAGFDLFINYPGSIVAGTDAERDVESYLPTTQPWYSQVVAGNGDIVFTEPYFDEIDGVPLITIGRAVYYPNGTLMGTMCGDISIQDLVTQVESFDILETGYAAMIQSTGMVVAHPEAGPTLPDIGDVEINAADSSSALSSSQITDITSGEAGLLIYTRNLQDRYLAYRPVSKGDYICLVIVPVAEAIAAIAPLQQNILLASQTTTWQVLIIIVLIAVAALGIGLVIANSIMNPITRLTKLAVSLSTERARQDIMAGLDQELKDLGGTGEIGDLTRAFRDMVDSVREEEHQLATGSKLCPNCQSPIGPRWKTCIYCGHDLEAPAPVASETARVRQLIARGKWEEAARLGAPAVSPLAKALTEGNPDERRGAADALGILGDAAVEPLSRALQDDDEYVRWRSAVNLGRIGNRRATPHLVRALKDKDSLVRSGAAWALGRIKDPKALTSLKTALKSEKDSGVQKALKEAIAKF